MTHPERHAMSGDIFEHYAMLSVEDLSRMCAVDPQHIVQLVEEGVLSVTDVRAPDWRFTGAAVRRTRIALRLERDLEINLPGVALVLELIEEIEQLRRDLKVGR